MIKNELTASDWRRIIAGIADAIEQHKDKLNELDGRAGDGDHGVTMSIGYRAVRESIAGMAPDASVDQVLNKTGRTFLSAAGGAIGPLLGTIWMDGAKTFAEMADCGPAECRAFIVGMEVSVERRGKAKVGDKSMLDALHAAAEAVRDEPANDIREVWRRAADAATAAAAATAALMARIGRASRVGERSIGFADAGATSIALTLESIAGSVDRLCQEAR